MGKEPVSISLTQDHRKAVCLESTTRTPIESHPGSIRRSTYLICAQSSVKPVNGKPSEIPVVWPNNWLMITLLGLIQVTHAKSSAEG